MEQNEVKKNKVGLIVLLMVLVLALGGIVGFLVGKNMVEPNTEIKEESKEDEKEDTENEEVQGGDDVEELKEEQLKFNKENDDKYVPGALLNIYDENMIPGDKRNRSNILVDSVVKFEFAYYVAMTKYNDKSMDIEQEEYPEEMTSGYNIAVEYNTLKNYYKELYGSELTDSMLPTGFKLYNGYVYGGYVTGVSYWPTVEGIEFVKYGNTYYYRTKATVGESKTTYTIQFELEKKDSNYILKSIIAY